MRYHAKYLVTYCDIKIGENRLSPAGYCGTYCDIKLGENIRYPAGYRGTYCNNNVGDNISNHCFTILNLSIRVTYFVNISMFKKNVLTRQMCHGCQHKMTQPVHIENMTHGIGFTTWIYIIFLIVLFIIYINKPQL